VLPAAASKKSSAVPGSTLSQPADLNARMRASVCLRQALDDCDETIVLIERHRAHPPGRSGRSTETPIAKTGQASHPGGSKESQVCH